MFKTQPNQAANNSNSLFANDSRKELIPIIQKQGEKLIDARQLHEFLEVKTRFDDWFRYRIKDYSFKEGTDFLITKISGAVFQGGGHNKKDYHLTLDMAKELAMLERSDKGRQIRQYFIACEKKLRVFHTKALMPEAVAFKMEQIDKAIKPIKVNNRKLYDYRKVQSFLDFSLKSSLSNVRRCYDGQLVIFDQKSYVSEDYVRVMISRANTRNLEASAKVAQAVLQISFSNPLNFSNP